MRFCFVAALVMSVTAARAEPDDFVMVERGRALVTAGDCVACHTPPGGAAFSGGRGISTPFGVIVSANLTPDLNTGLGGWTETDFARAMHDGIAKDGSHLYPAFPYPFYTRVSRADSDAIFAFLRSLPAVTKRIDRDTLPFPFRIRASMVAWNALFFTPGRFVPDASKSAEFNRGAYLVEGLGHCGACHTPMNMLGGSRTAEALQGNQIQDWYAPNITNDNRAGLGSWSEDEIVEYLHSGRNVHAAATGPMAEVVMYSTAQMPDADLHAMAAYLKARGAASVAAPAPVSTSNGAMTEGAAIYRDTCAACHAVSGEGVERLFPRLAGAASVQQADATDLTRIVLGGGRAASTAVAPTSPAMPALGWRLDDGQVAAVLTYVRNAWGNAAPAVTGPEVAKMRALLAE